MLTAILAAAAAAALGGWIALQYRTRNEQVMALIRETARHRIADAPEGVLVYQVLAEGPAMRLRLQGSAKVPLYITDIVERSSPSGP